MNKRLRSLAAGVILTWTGAAFLLESLKSATGMSENKIVLTFMLVLVCGYAGGRFLERGIRG